MSCAGQCRIAVVSTMRHVWTAIRDRVASFRTVPLSSPTVGVVSGAARAFFTEAYWIAFGREILPLELRDEARGFRDGLEDAVARRLVTSSEFGDLYRAVKEHGHFGLERRRLAAWDRALGALGSDEHFIRRAYTLLMRRE